MVGCCRCGFGAPAIEHDYRVRVVLVEDPQTKKSKKIIQQICLDTVACRKRQSQALAEQAEREYKKRSRRPREDEE